jgi:hypothetical protein
LEITDDIKAKSKLGYLPSRYIGFAHSGLFDKLARHPYTIDTYKYFPQPQSVALLNQALGTAGLPIQDYYSVLQYGDITFIRVTDASEMTANEARVFPIDVDDMFEMHFAPTRSAADMSQNSVAEAMYYREQKVDDIDQPHVKMVAETNYLAVLKRPEFLVRVVIG